MIPTTTPTIAPVGSVTSPPPTPAATTTSVNSPVWASTVPLIADTGPDIPNTHAQSPVTTVLTPMTTGTATSTTHQFSIAALRSSPRPTATKKTGRKRSRTGASCPMSWWRAGVEASRKPARNAPSSGLNPSHAVAAAEPSAAPAPTISTSSVPASFPA